MVLLRIWCWSLMRFDEIVIVPVPCLTQLRTSRGTDIPDAYKVLKTAAVKFISHGYSSEIARAFAAELRVAI